MKNIKTNRRLSLVFPCLLFLLFTVACDNESNVVDIYSEGDTDNDTAESDMIDVDGDAEPIDGDSENTGIDEAEDDIAEQEEDLPGIAEGLPPRPDFAPSLLVHADQKENILARIEHEPYSEILAEIQERAARDHYDFPEPDTFDSAEQRNGETAMAAAFLAWLLDDEEMGDKAREFLHLLSGNWESHEDFDINIRLPSIMMGYCFAIDFLKGADMLPEDEETEAEEKLTYIIGEFYKDYILNEFNRLMSISLTQNNHPIRTACSIGTAALAFPDHPDAPAWANWAFSELDYLWGPDGQYVQPDGGVSEGTFYYRFAFAPSLALFVAWDNRVGEARKLLRDCTNRQTVEPWAGYECNHGEPFVYENPLHKDRFPKSADWSFSLRMPSGYRPPNEDGNLRHFNGTGILAHYQDRPDFLWDWYNDERNMGGGFDLRIPHLAYLPEDMEAVEPEWKHRVMFDAGQAVFRNGWDKEAIWTLINAEHGSVRMTVHDHIDSGSFTLAAYGEYLLIDCGYYKPNMANNAITAQAASHNLLMIEEEPVPPKGLLHSFGDADAWLQNEIISDKLAYVEARQDLEISSTERSVAFLRDRYLVIADRITTTATEQRHHTWRLHGYSGYDMGGRFEILEDHVLWEKEKAGVETYLAATAEGLEYTEPPYEKNKAPHVHKFVSDQKDHAVFDGKITASVPGFLAVVAPYRVGAQNGEDSAVLTVERVDSALASEGVAGWIVNYKEHRDLVLLRNPGSAEIITLDDGTAIETDAELVILSLQEQTDLALIARGSRLIVNENTIFTDATDEVSYFLE